MTWLSLNIYFGVLLAPFIASFFLALIPHTDAQSQEKVARFFTLALLIALFYAGYDLWRGLSIHPIIIHFTLWKIKIHTYLTLNVDNFFLYFTLVLAFCARLFFYNSLQKKPARASLFGHMLLMGIAFLIFGQNDMNTALTLASITTLIISLMVSQSVRSFRGLSIYQAGIFLYGVDALALLLGQIPVFFQSFLEPSLYASFILLPGLTRTLIPFFSPWGKNIITNAKEKDLAFMTCFFCLIGYSLLQGNKYIVLSNKDPIFLAIFSSICVISAVYISLTALLEKSPQILCFHFITYYISLSVCLFFAPPARQYSYLSLAILSTGLLCFVACHSVAHRISELVLDNQSEKRCRVLWCASLCLMIGIPGIGTGTALWPALYSYVNIFMRSSTESLSFILLFQLLGWFIGLLLLAASVASSVRLHIRHPKKTQLSFQYLQHKMQMKQAWMTHFIITIGCWLIPFFLFSLKSA